MKNPVPKKTHRRMPRRRILLALAAGATLSVAGPAAAASPNQTALASAVRMEPANLDSTDASVSASGRYVAFTSLATNLSEADGPGVRDVFVCDTLSGEVELVSRANGPDGAGADGDSYSPSISADGRRVAFVSEYDDLTDEDGDGLDVFVRDLDTGETTLVSRASGVSGEGGDSSSHSPALSADGRYVAFESNADNLSPAAGDYGNVYVRDLERARTTLVSRAAGRKGEAAAGNSGAASISAGGRYVAFESTAGNLSRDDSDLRDVFVRDLRKGRTLLASRGSGRRGGGNGDSWAPAISGDGGSVAFVSRADNLAKAGDDTRDNVFVRDLDRGRTTLVSRRSGRRGAGADGDSSGPSISAKGRFVAFTSDADNLGKQDNDAYRNVFVRDLGRARNELASRATGAKGSPADADAGAASISASGRHVAFESGAENLSTEDEALSDVFVRSLSKHRRPR